MSRVLTVLLGWGRNVAVIWSVAPIRHRRGMAWALRYSNEPLPSSTLVPLTATMLATALGEGFQVVAVPVVVLKAARRLRAVEVLTVVKLPAAKTVVPLMARP